MLTLLIVALLSSLAAAQLPITCECSIWVSVDSSPMHPNPYTGVIYPLAHPASNEWQCGNPESELTCKSACIDAFRTWEAEFVGYPGIIPEGDIAYDPRNPNQTWGELFCNRMYQKYVECGGALTQFPGGEAEVPQLFWRLKNCRNVEDCREWIDLAESAPDQLLCCSNLGDWEPDNFECNPAARRLGNAA